MSMALALDLASKTKDQNRANNALSEIKLVLANPLFRELKPEYKSIEDALAGVTKNWQGLVEIKSSLAHSNSEPSVTTIQNLATLVEESITNSVRHGLATEVWIEINSAESELIELSVTDNGVGIRSSNRGLGSALFDSICGSSWKLENREGTPGAFLTAQINN